MNASHILFLVLVGGALVAFLIFEHVTGGSVGKGDRKGGAKLAGRGDVRGLHVRSGKPTTGRIVLGRHQGHLIATHERSSCLIAGLTQHAFKTSGLMIPNVLEWDGPVFATSSKGDVLRATIEQRRKVGDVKVFDPAGAYVDVPAGERGTWSPIHATGGKWITAMEVASALVQVGVEPTGATSDERYFTKRGADLLAPLLLAAYHGHKSMADVLAWVKRDKFEEPEQVLRSSNVEGREMAIDDLMFAVNNQFENYRQSVFQTLGRSLAAWQHPSVAHATGGTGDITVDWLLGGGGRNTLYVAGTEKTQEVFAPLFGAIVSYLIGESLDRAERRRSGRLDRALLVGLDEVANTAPVTALDRYASSGASRGIQLVTVVQNVSQLQLRYGDAKAETILANHAAKLLCAGLNDLASLQYAERVAGQQHVTRQSKHAPSGMLATGARSTTAAEQLEPLVPPHELRTAKEATALLIYGRTPPMWVDLRRYYLDKQLRNLVPAELVA